MKKYKKKYVHDPNYSKKTVLVVVPVVVGAKKSALLFSSSACFPRDDFQKFAESSGGSSFPLSQSNDGPGIFQCECVVSIENIWLQSRIVS
jgi:hypothetical protein